MTKRKVEDDPYEGFRMAKGNKFLTVLDSYVYLMALLGNKFEEHIDQQNQWLVLLTSDDFLYDAELLAYNYGLHLKHLGLTDAETAELSACSSIVVIEDIYGLVEVNYFSGFEDAWNLMDEMYTFGISTSHDTQKRISVVTPKPRKKRKKKTKKVIESDLVGANYD
jgi:hypothetical protein